MHDLNITLVQTALHWGDAPANLEHLGRLLYSPGPTDLVILPEMFNTGFLTEPAPVAETMEGPSIEWMREQAARMNAAVCGSLIVREAGNYYNRLIFMMPDGTIHKYDKRHLFTMSGEHYQFSKGNERLVISFKGWKIMPLVCYDLRFPAWSRNRWQDGSYEYDLLIYVANWPEVRSHTWKSLLPARAIENLSYAAAVNRIGKDGNDIAHSGDSAVIDPKGQHILAFQSHAEMVRSAALSADTLMELREKFNAGPDWDRLRIDD